MAYEKINLLVAGVSGEIYMAAINNDGTMSMKRRKVTDDCKLATAEWFMKNRKKMVQYGGDEEGKKPTLFFTDDSEKAKRILAILEEES